MTRTIKENVITLDITVDDILAMQMRQSLAGLYSLADVIIKLS